MNTKTTRPLEGDRLRSLAAAWLDGSISKTEERELTEFALSASKRTDVDNTLDRDTHEVLRLIAATSDYSAAMLSEAAASMPEDLERRIKNHIHSLARAEKRVNPWRRRVLNTAAAAASLAILAGAAWHFIPTGSQTTDGDYMAHMEKEQTGNLASDSIKNTPPLASESNLTANKEERGKESEGGNRAALSASTSNTLLAASTHKEKRSKGKKTKGGSRNIVPEVLAEVQNVETDESIENISQEEINYYAQLLDENLSQALAETADINRRILYDFRTVGRMLENIEDCMELTQKRVSTALVSSVSHTPDAGTEPLSMPTDPLAF